MPRHSDQPASGTLPLDFGGIRPYGEFKAFCADELKDMYDNSPDDDEE